MYNCLFVPVGAFAVDDNPVTKGKKEIAEMLKKGEKVKVTGSGELVTPDDPKASNALTVPDGKLASQEFYWYDRMPKLFKRECDDMRKFFPRFEMRKLDDGRLYWTGTVNPRKNGGGVWTLMTVYGNDHPRTFDIAGGSSVRVYTIDPTLEELNEKLLRAGARKLPHVIDGGSDGLHICTVEVASAYKGGYIPTAASAIGWASKWIWLVEGWLNGEIEDYELFDHDLKIY